MTAKLTSKQMLNRKFGEWTVRSKDEARNGTLYWNCVCSCGTHRSVDGSGLRKGVSKSCGCVMRSLTTEPGAVGFSKLLAQYHKGAKHKGVSFDLIEAEFRRLTSAYCHYCGAPPRSTITHGDSDVSDRARMRGMYRYNGLDCVNHKIGYMSSNVVTCCKTCNFMKGRLSYWAFVAKVKQIAAHHGT